MKISNNFHKPITEIQLRYSHTLARTQGHLWANLPLEETIALLGKQITPSTIEQRCSLLFPNNGLSSISYPNINESDDVSFVSNDKTVIWNITKNGKVGLFVVDPLERFKVNLGLVHGENTHSEDEFDSTHFDGNTTEIYKSGLSLFLATDQYPDRFYEWMFYKAFYLFKSIAGTETTEIALSHFLKKINQDRTKKLPKTW